MMSPKVTVLMPVYNGERFLREAIESILNQTFTDFEFLIIDDGSTDATGQILSEYAQRDERIRIVMNATNIGLTKSLNKGIDLAKGEYIARMDADDISVVERLEKQVRFMEANTDVGVCGTWGYIINEEHCITGELIRATDAELVQALFLFGNELIHSSVIMKKTAVLHVGRYNEDFERTQDFDLWQRCIAANIKIVNMPEYLIQLRIHNESISNAQRERQEQLAQQVLRNAFASILGMKVGIRIIANFRLIRNYGSKKSTTFQTWRMLLFLHQMITHANVRFSVDSTALQFISEQVNNLFILIERELMAKTGMTFFDTCVLKLCRSFRRRIDIPLK